MNLKEFSVIHKNAILTLAMMALVGTVPGGAQSIDDMEQFRLVCAQNPPETVSYWISHGATATYVFKDGTTALDASIENPNDGVIKLLLQSGASANDPDKNAETPIVLAASNQKNANNILFDVAKSNARKIQVLLDAGVPVDQKDSKGETALLAAAQAGNSDAIKILLKAGASINATDNKGQTVLVAAASANDYYVNPSQVNEVVDLLISAGADLNAAAPGGTTPLLVTVITESWGGGNFQHPEYKGQVLLHLLKAGANANVKDADGYTPMDWALGTPPETVGSGMNAHGPGGFKDTPEYEALKKAQTIPLKAPPKDDPVGNFLKGLPKLF